MASQFLAVQKDNDTLYFSHSALQTYIQNESDRLVKLGTIRI